MRKNQALSFSALVLAVILCVAFSSCEKEKEETYMQFLLDDGYEAIDIVKGQYSLSVILPGGNPRVPTLTAPDGARVGQTFAFDADGEAKAFVTFPESGERYTVVFTCGGDGFVLQIGDEWKFVPSYSPKDGEKIVFTSDDYHTVDVENDGTLKARKLSETPVSVIAEVNGVEVDRLTISRVIKKQISAVISLGGVNAAPTFGNSGEAPSVSGGKMLFASSESQGKVTSEEKLGGYYSSFAKSWSESTGETVLMFDASDALSSLSDWTEGGDSLEKAVFGVKALTEKYKEPTEKYEIRRICAVWFHGEKDHETEEALCERAILDTYEKMRSEFDIAAFCMIAPSSSRSDRIRSTLDGPRVAAYAAHNREEKIFLASRLPETVNERNGLIAANGITLSQAGSDMLGEEIASNLFGRLFEPSTKIEKLIFLNAQGKDQTANGGSFTAQPDGKSFAVVSLPLTAFGKIEATLTGGGELSLSPCGIPYATSETSGGQATYTAGDAALSVALSAYKPEKAEPADSQTTSPKTEAELRQAEIDAMREMATIEWIPAIDVTMSGNMGSLKPTCLAGVKQRGMMYGRSAKSIDEFRKQLIDGVYFGPSVSTADVHCNTAVYYALLAADPDLINRLDPAVDQISLHFLPYMEGTGIVAKGDYVYEKPETISNETAISAPITTANGREKMYSCYALLEKGDVVAMRKGKSNSHSRLVSSVNVIYKDGKISGDSYLYCLEQGVGYNDTANGYTTWSLSSKVTFKSLFDGYYIPLQLEIYAK